MKQCCKDYLMEQFGDEDVTKEIYAEYVNSVQEKLPELETALTTENWSSLDQLAHAVKGNALAAGDAEMAETAITLRKAAALSDAAEAASLIAKLRELATQL